jgi:hypothetical protein
MEKGRTTPEPSGSDETGGRGTRTRGDAVGRIVGVADDGGPAHHRLERQWNRDAQRLQADRDHVIGLNRQEVLNTGNGLGLGFVFQLGGARPQVACVVMIAEMPVPKLIRNVMG